MAMGFGKAIVAPNKGAIPELVHPDALIAYEEQSADGLSQALYAALTGADWRERGEKNKQRVIENHSPEVAGKKYLALYKEILRK